MYGGHDARKGRRYSSPHRDNRKHSHLSDLPEERESQGNDVLSRNTRQGHAGNSSRIAFLDNAYNDAKEEHSIVEGLVHKLENELLAAQSKLRGAKANLDDRRQALDSAKKGAPRPRRISALITVDTEEMIEVAAEAEEKDEKKRIQRHYDSLSDSLLHHRTVTKLGQSPYMRWLSSFRRLDPRYDILTYFDDLSNTGAFLKLFKKVSVFSVWRPTSKEAIKKMMLGSAVGKGLEIKGKSAKKGLLSAFVPFVQIYEDRHKERIRECVRDNTMKIFYGTRHGRDEAVEVLQDVVEMMMFYVQDAMRLLSDPYATPEEQKMVMKNLQWDGCDLGVKKIDEYAPQCYGVAISERLFWEGYVTLNETDRPRGSIHDTGRPSEPTYQDMNFKAVRHKPTVEKDGTKGPIPVVFQMDENFPMSPRTLVVAYEEASVKRVMPVVSDFDCFLLGTRGIVYDQPLPADQVELITWAMSKIETLLDTPSTEGWTTRWLDVLKKAAVIEGFYPKMPPYGYGDPKSYGITEQAVSRLKRTGAVRHGAECFNYYFPQELDEEFLIVSDSFKPVPWKYVGFEELQEFLKDKIDNGFTMPLNPKWILCDPGWKDVFDKLKASRMPNVQESLNVWYPKHAGICEMIERIFARHPRGFQTNRQEGGQKKAAKIDMDDAEFLLSRFLTVHNTTRRIRAHMYCKLLAQSCDVKNDHYWKYKHWR